MPDEIPRYDVLIVPADRSVNLSEGAYGALVRYLAVRRIAEPVEEALAETWAEVYMKPGAAAHDAFVRRGTYDGPTPVFLEGCARVGSTTASPGYGVGTGALHFYLELRGAAFDRPAAALLKKVREILSIRVDTFTRPHEALPPHREVPPDEVRKDRPRRTERGPGRAGTAVEEW